MAERETDQTKNFVRATNLGSLGSMELTYSKDHSHTVISKSPTESTIDTKACRSGKQLNEPKKEQKSTARPRLTLGGPYMNLFTVDTPPLCSKSCCYNSRASDADHENEWNCFNHNDRTDSALERVLIEEQRNNSVTTTKFSCVDSLTSKVTKLSGHEYGVKSSLRTENCCNTKGCRSGKQLKEPMPGQKSRARPRLTLGGPYVNLFTVDTPPLCSKSCCYNSMASDADHENELNSFNHDSDRTVSPVDWSHFHEQRVAVIRPAEQEEEEASMGDPDSVIKHPLQNSWAMWFFKNDKTRDWKDNLRVITTFDTVEDFWGLYNHTLPASKLQSGCDYSVFKAGIQPMWEDAQNKKGGRWLINLNKSQRQPHLDDLWLETLLCLIGEGFDEYSDDICGATVNIRTKGDKLGLWTRDASRNDATRKIGIKLKESLNVPPKIVIGFQAHSDTAGKAGSTVKNRFTV